jgi:hypothetical protein
LKIEPVKLFAGNVEYKWGMCCYRYTLNRLICCRNNRFGGEGGGGSCVAMLLYQYYFRKVQFRPLVYMVYGY